MEHTLDKGVDLCTSTVSHAVEMRLISYSAASLVVLLVLTLLMLEYNAQVCMYAEASVL